jgi:hypothetical protein
MNKKRDKPARARAENTLIQEYFNFKNNGCFVEVGANDPTNYGSQSYHLEINLRWNGVLIEPVPEMAEKCRQTRSNCKVFECACIDTVQDEKIKLYIPESSNQDDVLHSKASIGKNIDDGKKQGYALVKRTRQNCWYIPVGAKRPPQTLFDKIKLFKRMYISIWSKKLAFSIRHKTLKPLKQL